MLTKFPDEIIGLEMLEQLSLECNEIESIPKEFFENDKLQ